MSWQAYVDRMVGQKVEMCGIYGKNGSPWAASPNCTASPSELAVLEEALRTNNGSIYATGVTLCGQRWTVVRMENNLMILKGKDKDNAKQNMIVAEGVQSIIMGANVCDDVCGGAVRCCVEGMRDYLKSVGY